VVDRLPPDTDDDRRALQEALAAIPREADPPSALASGLGNEPDERTSLETAPGTDGDVLIRQVSLLHSFIARRFHDLERRMDALEAFILAVSPKLGEDPYRHREEPAVATTSTDPPAEPTPRPRSPDPALSATSPGRPRALRFGRNRP